MVPLKPQLKIQLTFKQLSLFIIFFFLMHELHEFAHVITSRIVCGDWGTRDFNVWRTCENCRYPALTVLATFAGPTFTFIMLWLGRYLVKYGKSINHQSFGLLLILGNMQFGRIYMAAMGGGDEIWGMRYLFLSGDHSNVLLIRLITLLAVSIICIPPLVTAYQVIVNRKKILVFIGFIIIPLVLDTVVILILLNGILEKGILNQLWIMGTPLLITIWFLVCAAIVGGNWKSIKQFAR